MVKALDSQFRGPVFKTFGWLQVRLSLQSFWGQSNNYQKFMGTYWCKVNCLLVVALYPWGSWTPSMKKGFATQTLLWSPKFIIHQNLERHTITVSNLAQSWIFLTVCMLVRKKFDCISIYTLKSFSHPNGYV